MIFATKSLKHPGTITETLIVLYINNRPLKANNSHYRSTDNFLGVFLTEHVCEIPKQPYPAHVMINNTLHACSLHDPLAVPFGASRARIFAPNPQLCHSCWTGFRKDM